MPLLTIIAAVVCSCQKPPPAVSEPPVPLLPPVVSERYFLHDHACQEQTPAATAQPTQIYLTDFAQPLHLDTSKQSLHTPLIDNTFYGQTYRRLCHFHSKQHCLDRDFLPVPWQKIDESGGLLRICATEQEYPRESFEHVALVTALHLQKAQRFFTDSTGQDVPRLSLLVMPFFRTIYTDEEGELQQRLMYRNIIYYPASKSLAVLPDNDNFYGRSLWESTFIIAHEFAHHVQFANHQKWQTDHVAASDLGTEQRHPERRAAQRSLEAFLEGWADLYAFYAENENPSDIISYPCFGYNRDIANPVFADRSRKTITPDIVTAFYTGTRTSSSCTYPDFSDTHIVGAILAHHLHHIVNFVLYIRDEIPSPTTKYRYIHNWLSTVFTRLQNEGSNSNPLRTIIAAIFQETAHTLPSHTTGQLCTLFETGFPTLSGCRAYEKVVGNTNWGRINNDEQRRSVVATPGHPTKQN